MKRVFLLAFKKIRVLFGGRLWLFPLSLALISVCLLAVRHAVTAEANTNVRISMIDECKGPLSTKLTEAIKNAPGFTVLFPGSVEKAEDDIAEGRSEAIVIISADYDQRLGGNDGHGLIRVLTAPGSVSADMIRETVSGKLLLSRAELRVRQELAAEGLDDRDYDRFALEFSAPKLYSIRETGGGSSDRAVFGQGFPGYAGFVSLAIMLVLLSLSKQFSERGALLVGARLGSIKNGRAAAFLSDALSLLSPILAYSAAAFAIAPARSTGLAFGLVSYAVCITGLCRLSASVGGSGRIDMASPVIALVTSILGGCFVDTGSLSPALAVIAKFTPQGQFIAVTAGKPVFCAVLIAEGLALAFLSRVLKKRG